VTPAGTNWFYYCPASALQTFLWLLLFLAIIVAVWSAPISRVPLRRILIERNVSDRATRRTHD